MLTKLLPVRPLLSRLRYSFAEDKKDQIDGEDLLRPNKQSEETTSQLKRRFTGQIKIQERFHGKTSALYDRYLQTRQAPLVCNDGLHVAYEFLIERPPIFAPYHPKKFSIERNRYVYAKKTGFYVPIPKDMRIDDAEEIFKEYDEINEQNEISHQIVLSQTEKISYRQNSKVWRYTDPTTDDPHSIQTHPSDTVYLIVKQKDQWMFPTKILNQKDTHTSVFHQMSLHLFQATPYPVVHFPTRIPLGCRKVDREGLKNKVRVYTFRGMSAFGIPEFPTNRYTDFAWVPKPLLANYFSDGYHEQAAWAAVQTFP